MTIEEIKEVFNNLPIVEAVPVISIHCNKGNVEEIDIEGIRVIKCNLVIDSLYRSRTTKKGEFFVIGKVAFVHPEDFEKI